MKETTYRPDCSVLISGGAGFIGSDFVRRAVNESLFKKIFVLDCFTYAADLRRLEEVAGDVEVISSDINDVSKYHHALKECDFVVHMAAESHVDRSIASGNSFIHSNVAGTYALLEATRANPESIFVHVSTDEVYGSRKTGESTEYDVLSPSSIYSASKAASDLLVLANFTTHRQKVTITRCTNNFGPYQHSEKFIPTVINNALLGKEIPIYGTGLNQREWIDVSDHNNAVMAIIRNFSPGEVWNIGSGQRITNYDLASEILSILDADKKLLTFVEDRKGHDFRYALNTTKIESNLGWKPNQDFAKSLRNTVSWYKNWYNNHGEVY